MGGAVVSKVDMLAGAEWEAAEQSSAKGQCRCHRTSVRSDGRRGEQSVVVLPTSVVGSGILNRPTAVGRGRSCMQCCRALRPWHARFAQSVSFDCPACGTVGTSGGVRSSSPPVSCPGLCSMVESRRHQTYSSRVDVAVVVVDVGQSVWPTRHGSIEQWAQRTSCRAASRALTRRGTWLSRVDNCKVSAASLHSRRGQPTKPLRKRNTLQRLVVRRHHAARTAMTAA